MKRFFIFTAVAIALILVVRQSIVFERAFKSLSDIWARAIGSLTRGEDYVQK